MKKSKTREPDKRTIEHIPGPKTAKYKWDVLKSCRFYTVGPKFKIKKLRGVIIQPKKRLGETRYKVIISSLYNDPKKLKGGWKHWDEFVISIKDIVFKPHYEDYED